MNVFCELRQGNGVDQRTSDYVSNSSESSSNSWNLPRTRSPINCSPDDFSPFLSNGYYSGNTNLADNDLEVITQALKRMELFNQGKTLAYQLKF